RNTYGESGARSRFAVAKAKRNCRSRERAAARQATALADRDPDGAERLEGRSVVKHGGGWRKIPDKPLGEVVARKLTRWQRSGGVPPEVVETKRSRIRGK